MFSYQFEKNGSTTLTSGSCPISTVTVSTADFNETDAINLTEKRHDLKKLSLYIDVPATTSPSQTSAYLSWYIAGGYDKSSVTFPIEFNSSGTSLFLNNTSGTSQGAGTSYSKFLPAITYVGGTSYWLSSIPYVRLGCRAIQHRGTGVSTVNYTAWLMVG